MKRLGIIYVPWRFFEDDEHGPYDKKSLKLEDIVKIINLPSSFVAKDFIWDFDTGGVKLKVESIILPLHIEGELICAVDLIYEVGIPTKCLIYNRIIIKEHSYEKALI